MQFTEYKIIGIDEARPPKIQRQPCIDLVFELNETAPEDWCKQFQVVVGKTRYPITIDPVEGLFVETWVRKASEIAASLELIKSFVAKGNDAYKAMVLRNSDAPVEEGVVVELTPEQKQLNEIVSGLYFD